MQSIFNTTSLQAKWSAQLLHYSVFNHGNIIAEVCPSGQFVRFVNAGTLLCVDTIDELKIITTAIAKQNKELHPEQLKIT